MGPLFRFLHNHQVVDEFGKLIGYKNLRSINKTLEDILIRRTKKEIMDQLPGRMDKNFFVEMTAEQISDHKDYYDVPARQRKTMIESFQRDRALKLFLSTDAGGVGINLQSANILINIDLPWNPAKKAYTGL